MTASLHWSEKIFCRHCKRYCQESWSCCACKFLLKTSAGLASLYFIIYAITRPYMGFSRPVPDISATAKKLSTSWFYIIIIIEAGITCTSMYGWIPLDIDSGWTVRNYDYTHPFFLTSNPSWPWELSSGEFCSRLSFPAARKKSRLLQKEVNNLFCNLQTRP